MAIAVLSIDLEAKLAKFEADMGRASHLLNKFSADAKGSFAGIGSVFAGSLLSSAAEQAIRSLVSLFPSLVNGVAAFQDLSEETGASAAKLAQFQTSADVSGVSVSTLAGLMNKLTGNLAKLTDEGRGAGAALKALGVPLEEFRALTPDEQIKRLASEFEKFADGSGKTAVALALFGKSGAQVLKFFREFSTGAGESNRLTDEMIQRADAFADAQAKSQSEMRQFAQVIAVQSLPAITALKQGFIDGARELLGFGGEAKKLNATDDILNFAERGAVAIAIVSESLVGLVKLAAAVGGSFQAVGADIALPFKVASAAATLLEGKSLAEAAHAVGLAVQERNATVAAANKRYVDLWTYNGTAVSDAVRKSFATIRTELLVAEFPDPPAPGKALPKLKLTVPTKDDEENTKARDRAFAHFLTNVAKQEEIAQAQIETGGKLSDSERKRIELASELNDQEKGFLPTQKAIGQAAADSLVAKLKQFELEQDLVKTRAGAQAIEDRAVAARGKEIDSLIAGNQALRDQTEELGKTAEQVDALRIARLQLRAVDEDVALIGLKNAAASEAEIAAAERSLELLRQQIALRKVAVATAGAIAQDPLQGASAALAEYMKRVSESGTATKQAASQALSLLEDDLTSSLASSKLSVSRTINFIIAEFLRLQVVRPLLKSLFDGLGGSGGGILAKLFGFADGGAFGPSGPVPFANGGIVTSPQLFKFAQGGSLATGVMGEAGPEAIIPLQRGAGGKLGVRAYGGGGGVTVIQNNTIGGGVSRAEVAVAMRHAEQSAIAAIADAQRRGRRFA